MKTIHKYPLKAEDRQRVSMPDEAELLTVQYQPGFGACLWALVDTAKPHAARKIMIRGTGHPAEDVGRYIATFQIPDEGLVFHVFEDTQPSDEEPK